MLQKSLGWLSRMEQNAQLSLLPAGSGTITAMSGGGGGGQTGGAKPFGLARDAFDAQKLFLEKLTGQTKLTYDKLQDPLVNDTCKRAVLSRMKEKLTDVQALVTKGDATIEITITRK